MKKRFLVTAIAAGLVSSMAATAAPTVYGIAHASLDSGSGVNAKFDGMAVSSNKSRLGFKGSEDLGGGMKVIYKMEMGVDLTDGAGFSTRNQYVGLGSAMGTVLLGTHDTPLKMAQGKFDNFNDTVTDMGAGGLAGVKFVDGEDRVNNILAYISPNFGGVKAAIALIPGETAANDGISDGTSIAFMYDKKGLFASLAINSTKDVGLADETRLVATYKMDKAVVGGLYSTSEIGAGDQVSFGLSGSMKLDSNNTVKLRFISNSDIGGVKGADDNDTTLGIDHSMSKSTSVYALYDTHSDADADTMSFGMKTKF